MSDYLKLIRGGSWEVGQQQYNSKAYKPADEQMPELRRVTRKLVVLIVVSILGSGMMTDVGI